MQIYDLYPQLHKIPEGQDKPLIDIIENESYYDEDYPDAQNKTTIQSFTSRQHKR